MRGAHTVKIVNDLVEWSTLFATQSIRHRINLTLSQTAIRPSISAHPVWAQSLTRPNGGQAHHLRMFTSSMKIIQAKLFRRLRSADPNGAGKTHIKECL